MYVIDIDNNTIQKLTDTNYLADLFNVKKIFGGGIKDSFVVNTYKNVPLITYCIDHDKRCCYVNCKDYAKCNEILTGREIWTYRPDTQNAVKLFASGCRTVKKSVIPCFPIKL